MGIGAVGVVSGTNLERLAEAACKILQVHGLGLCCLAVHVDEDDLVHEVTEHQAERAVRTDAASADNHDLAGMHLLLHGATSLSDRNRQASPPVQIASTVATIARWKRPRGQMRTQDRLPNFWSLQEISGSGRLRAP